MTSNKTNILVGFTLKDTTTVCLACATQEEYGDLDTCSIMLDGVENRAVTCTRCRLRLPGSKKEN